MDECRMAYICKDCHEQDKNIIDCPTNYDTHAKASGNMKCDVCGNIKDSVVFCWAYHSYVKRLPKEENFSECF